MIMFPAIPVPQNKIAAFCASLIDDFKGPMTRDAIYKLSHMIVDISYGTWTIEKQAAGALPKTFINANYPAAINLVQGTVPPANNSAIVNKCNNMSPTQFGVIFPVTALLNTGSVNLYSMLEVSLYDHSALTPATIPSSIFSSSVNGQNAQAFVAVDATANNASRIASGIFVVFDLSLARQV